MNDTVQSKATTGGDQKLITCLVAYEKDGKECLMEVQAQSLNYAGAVCVERVTGLKLNWAMRTSGPAERLPRWKRLLSRFFLRYS